MGWKSVFKSLFLSFMGSDGNPFSIMGFMFPANDAGKYIIESEGIRLAFVKKGGALANLWINDTKCNELDVVLGFDNATEYESYEGFPTLNGAIGRYAGLISQGSFEFQGVKYQTSLNSPDKQATLHGGKDGWSQMMLHPAAHTKDSITFVVFDRKGRNGFPGMAVSSLTHTVTPYEWRIAFGVTPLLKISPISLSQQVFWNLDGFAQGSTMTIDDHTLELPFSGMRLDTDEDGVPTGDIRGNKPNSTYDFWSRARAIGRESLDDTFLVSRRPPWRNEHRPVATLASATSGISMSLYTDQEALHAVTWEDEGAVRAKKTQQLGRPEVGRHAAISLQMQEWTDAVNHPEWQREETVFWGADRLYTMYATYKFNVQRSRACDGNVGKDDTRSAK